MTSSDLQGRVAVVTGAGSGFGAAAAHALARAGMAVAALDIDGGRAEQTAAALRAYGVESEAFRVDVGDPSSVRDAAARVEARFGGCHLVWANVGVQQLGSIDHLTDDDWTWVLSVNVLGTVRTVRAFLPLLRTQRGWRQIVLTASSAVLVPGVRLAAYTASKCAVAGFGETLRLELADEGIGVTLVLPAGMSTRHLESSAAARPAALGPSVLRREDIDAMLASDVGPTVAEVIPPEQAVAGVVAELLANEPYVLTHGSYRTEYARRQAAIDRAFDRMEARADTVSDLSDADLSRSESHSELDQGRA